MRDRPMAEAVPRGHQLMTQHSGADPCPRVVQALEEITDPDFYTRFTYLVRLSLAMLLVELQMCLAAA